MSNEETYVTLPGTEGAADYTTRLALPLPVEASGEWEMALVELHCPLTFFNVAEGEFVQVTLARDDGTTEDVRDTVRPGYYRDIDALLRAVNDTAEPAFHATFVHDRLGGGSRLQITPKVKRVQLSPTLATQLGFASDTIERPPSGSGTIRSLWPCDPLEGLPKRVHVLCNLARAQSVGEKPEPLLRAVQVDRDAAFGTCWTARFDDAPRYVPVAVPPPGWNRELTILLRDEKGRPVPFRRGAPCVTVHLRRRLR